MNWDEWIFNAELSTPWIVTQLQNFTNWHLTPLPTTGFVDEIKLNREGVKETPFFVRFWKNKRWNSGQQQQKQQYVFQDFFKDIVDRSKKAIFGALFLGVSTLFGNQPFHRPHLGILSPQKNVFLRLPLSIIHPPRAHRVWFHENVDLLRMLTHLICNKTGEDWEGHRLQGEL